jgi:hypothetical protein
VGAIRGIHCDDVGFGFVINVGLCEVQRAWETVVRLVNIGDIYS